MNLAKIVLERHSEREMGKPEKGLGGPKRELGWPQRKLGWPQRELAVNGPILSHDQQQSQKKKKQRTITITSNVEGIHRGPQNMEMGLKLGKKKRQKTSLKRLEIF